jgi:CheY-like chemotaxis protein
MAADPSAGPPAGGRRVLLVEDSPDQRESMRLLLTLLGHRVDVAADGVEGVRKALESPPDVAFIDIGLPRLDGFEVGRRLRAALGAALVLVAYTAYGDDATRRKLAEIGFDAHLVKPVDLSELTPWLGGRGVRPGSGPASAGPPA